MVGIDPFKEYVEFQKKMRVYDEVYQMRGESLKFADREFDLVIAQHVIEHVPRETGYRMLEEMERVSCNRVIVCTPHGYTASGPLDGNVDNNHVSGWYTEDFTKRGYKTRIVTKNVNSRLLVWFAKLVFALKWRRWDNEVLVAWKDV